MEEKAMPLSEISEGRVAIVVHIDASPAVRQRLNELGFIPDTLVQLLLSSSYRIICKLHNSRIGMQRTIADHIYVTPL